MNLYPDSRNGGIENVTRILSEQFVKEGHAVHIRYLFDSKFTHTDDSIFKSCEQIDNKNKLQAIRNTVKSHKIDVIINQGMLHESPTLKKAISEFNCILITAYHGQPTLNPPPIDNILANHKISLIKKLLILLSYPLFVYNSKRKQKKRCQESYYASDRTILLSKLHISEYSKMMDIDTVKLVYMNNPIRDNLNLNNNDLANKENSILIVSRLSEKEKCIIKSLKIWEKLVSFFPDWKLQIVGSGPDEKKIKEYAKKHCIKNVEFYPAQNPEKFYRKASIFLMTSRSEGWGCTTTEAMRLGCVPVAIGGYTAIYDIIDKEKNGIIISKSSQNNEITDCVKAISDLINDKDFLNKMAINAFKKTGLYSAKFIAKQWIELFKEISFKN